MIYVPHEFEILIDVDDVLVPCHARLCELAFMLLGIRLDPAKTPHKLEEVIGFANAQVIWDHIDKTPGWNAPEMSDETASALERLRLIGRVVAVTSPHTTGTWMNDRAAFLKKHGFEKDDIIMTSGKFRIPGSVLIDDLPRNLIAWKRRNPYGKAILWASACNYEGGPEYAAGLDRHDRWDDVIKCVYQTKQRWRQHLDTRYVSAHR